MTETEFIEKYRRLCGHIAWDFVKRSHRDVSPIFLTQEDAEDFASCALLKLLRCPEQHRDNKWYVQRIIENAIVTAWRKRLKQLGAEQEANKRSLSLTADEYQGDIFDLLPGPDGLAGKTQTKFDYAKVIALMPKLPDAQRIVLELSFGLNGCQACSPQRIAKKLGRTEWWAQKTFNAAIKNIQSELSSQRAIHAVS